MVSIVGERHVLVDCLAVAVHGKKEASVAPGLGEDEEPVEGQRGNGSERQL